MAEHIFASQATIRDITFSMSNMLSLQTVQSNFVSRIDLMTKISLKY